MDHYSLLGIARNADALAVEAAYKKFVDDLTLYAPGLRPGEQEIRDRMPLVWEAFVVIRDPEKRRAYDATFGAPEPEPEPVVEPAPPLQARIWKGVTTAFFLLLFLAMIIALANFFAL